MHIKSIWIFLFIPVLFACRQEEKLTGLTEGIIEYEITYLEQEENNPVIGLLPKKLELQVKEHMISSKIEGWMGIFSSNYITDIQSGKNSTLMKFLNKKYYYEGTIDEKIPGYQHFDEFEVIFKDESKQIIGYTCQKAIIVFSDSIKKPLELYYNNEFNMYNPFLAQIYFNKIPGFLFEFPLEMNGIKMVLRITNIKATKTNGENFIIPEGYIRVSREKIDEIIEDMI